MEQHLERRDNGINELRNVTSRKIKAIEQSHLDARFATPESSRTNPNYRVRNFNFEKKNQI